jgi:group I intron endonuclease
VFVYIITNKVNGKIYIGQHKGGNLKKYLQQKLGQAWYELKRKGHGQGSHLYNAMRKYPREDFSIEPLAEVHGDMPKLVLDSLETFCIAFLDTRNCEKGYNICRGGEGFTGPHSERSKQKQRLAMLGRKHTPEAIAKMKLISKTAKQLANLNRDGMSNISEETRKKVKEAARLRSKTEEKKQQWKRVLEHHSGQPLGFHHSDKTKAQISASKKGTPASNFMDISGQTINGIRVLERCAKLGKVIWFCRCFCGAVFEAESYPLRKGIIGSCGCLRIR